MRQAYRILPVYTGDISGAASALFELGGMTVIHDPSGCNSTYNTHDELRWYDRDSLIFITGLRDVDAIMGNDDKLIHDVLQAAEEFRPAFISLTNSPVPWMNGTDFEGIASVIEEQTGIPVFYVPSNGMHDYVRGAGLAFERLADRLVTDPSAGQFARDLSADRIEKEASADSSLKDTAMTYARPSKNRGRINVLGVTPLDFTLQTYVDDLSGRLTDAGWEINSLWAMGESLDRIKNAAGADLNLVVSSTGMKAAAEHVDARNTKKGLDKRLRNKQWSELSSNGIGRGVCYSTPYAHFCPHCGARQSCFRLRDIPPGSPC